MMMMMMMKMIFGAIGGMNLAGETEVLGGNLPGATLSTTKSHMTTRSRTPDRSGGKPATNRLSYGAAFLPFLLLSINFYLHCVCLTAQ
jgi:hypothetical protein